MLFFFFCVNIGKKLCLTSGCITTASQILNSMDTSVEPCDDFYSFACGNFVKNTYIPDDKLTVDTFNTLSDQIDIQLRTIIEDEINPNESKVFQLVKKMHKSCMNRTAVEALGLESFKKILKQMGNWPAVEGDKWDEKAWDWIKNVRVMRDIGLTTSYLISTSVGAHLKNSSTRSLRVSDFCFNIFRVFLSNLPNFIFKFTKFHFQIYHISNKMFLIDRSAGTWVGT